MATPSPHIGALHEVLGVLQVCAMERVRQLHLERGATVVLKLGQYDAEATEDLVNNEPDLQPLPQDSSVGFHRPYIRQVGATPPCSMPAAGGCALHSWSRTAWIRSCLLKHGQAGCPETLASAAALPSACCLLVSVPQQAYLAKPDM